MGGEDSVLNLTIITAREHFIVHHLLTKMYPNNRKLHYALSMMSSLKDKRNLTAKQYEICRIACTKAQKGIPKSEEHRKSMSKAHKGIPLSKEHRKSLSKAISGVPKTGKCAKGAKLSKKHRESMSKASKGVPKPLVTCPHCGKVGGNNIMKRYHFDNCKFKKELV